MDEATLAESLLPGMVTRAVAAMLVALPLRGTATLMDVAPPPPGMGTPEDAVMPVARPALGTATLMDVATLARKP